MLRNSPFILKSIICEPLCNTSPPNIVGSCVVDRLILSAPERDLSAVFNLSLIRHFKTAAIVVSDLWDSRVTLVDAMPDWDGTLAEDVGAKLQVATCQGVPTSSLASTYSQSQDLITITKSSHGVVVNDQVLVDLNVI